MSGFALLISRLKEMGYGAEIKSIDDSSSALIVNAQSKAPFNVKLDASIEQAGESSIADMATWIDLRIQDEPVIQAPASGGQ